MRPSRVAILALALLPSSVLGQAKDEDKDKISNDSPDRPLQMPAASSEVKEAFEDYERFRKRGAWERALKSLYTIPEDQASRFVDGQNGFIIPVARKRREVLAELPTEGQVAYRLFYDDEAKKLFAQADGESELKTLERIFSAYFPTSIGDNAADRLGNLYFEMGRFDRAADCWLAILRQHPDTDLSPPRISLKAALALARAGRRAEVVTLRQELAERHGGEKLSLGGRSATVDEHLRRLLGEDAKSHSAAGETVGDSGPGPDLTKTVPASWQMRFGESIVAGMTPPELTQWESNPLSAAVPTVAVEGTRLYGNFLGYLFAIDLKNGKLLWRSASFHNVEMLAAQGMARMTDPTRFAILASKGRVWSLGKDLKDQNQLASFHLSCRRADKGDVLWQSADLPEYAQVDLVGAPILVGETLFVVAKTTMMMQQQGGQAQQSVLAIRADDGKLLWKTEVAVVRQSQRYFYYGMTDSTPQPRLFHQAGSLYVDTHAGLLARLDAHSGDLEWGYGYQTEPVQSGGRFMFFGGNMEPKESTASGEPIRSGEALFGKGAKSERIYALDSDRMKLLWDRPIAKSARLIAADDRAVFLGGPDLCALDRKSRTLLWATRLPGGSGEARVLVRSNGIWQLTSRGIFELDPVSGRVRRIFRGDDTGSDGGDLVLAPRLLLAITNRTISAYPIEATANATGRSAAVGEGPTATKTRVSND